MSAHTALQIGLGKAFDALSAQFHPDAVVTLCNGSEAYDEFDDVYELTGSRFFEYSENRETVTLEIALDTDDVTNAVVNATHLKIDDDVYEIADRSRTAPKSTDVTWVVIGNKTPSKGIYE